MKFEYTCLLLTFLIYELISNVHGRLNKQERINLSSQLKRLLLRSQTCSDTKMCLSKWNYCGYGPDYCGEGCQGGPCTGNSENIINDKNFGCAFNDLDDKTRQQRLDGLKQSGWKPLNTDEAAVFLAHVYHETDGLRTLTEYCAPERCEPLKNNYICLTGCGPNYATSWCSIQGASGKLYYGRGWLQLSYPCNYYAAGKAIGLDLLKYPDLVSTQQDVAVKTAIWFYTTNNMAGPAQRGDFAATTRILNGPQECNGGPGATSQQTRVQTYKRIRLCFGLGQPKINPTC